MKKTICALSICSAVIYALSFLGAVSVIAFQSVLLPLIDYGWEADFVFPIAPVFSAFCMLALSLVALFTSFKKTMPLWLNILLIVLPVLAVTPLSSLIATLQWRFMTHDDGFNILSVFSVVNELITVAVGLSPLGYAAYLVCGGMRLAAHRKEKKLPADE